MPNQSSFMSEIASQMMQSLSSLFSGISVSPSHPISKFPLTGNHVYVLYSSHDLPLSVGSITDTMGTRERNALSKEVRGAGFAKSFRVIETGSEALVQQIEGWIMDLFRAVLPLANGIGSVDGPSNNKGQTSTGRGPGRPRKSDAGVPSGSKKKRGRPRKEKTDEAPAPTKKRGRPRKTEGVSLSAPATTKRRGRPAKVAQADQNAAPAKRRGRRPKSEAGEAVASKKRLTKTGGRKMGGSKKSSTKKGTKKAGAAAGTE